MARDEFVWYVFCLLVFVFTTYNGIVNIKTGSFLIRYSSKEHNEGTKAILVGVIFLIVGFASLVFLIIGFKEFLNINC